MARSRPLLTETQWQKIAPWLPKFPKNRRGGHPWVDNRRVFEGILWILRSGARWQDLPEKYPHPSTCWRRLRDWEEQRIWLNIWRAFLAKLNEREQLDWSESCSSGHAGWPGAAPVPAALGRRTHHRLARQFPPPGCALRPLAQDLWRVLSYRLLHDSLTEGCAIASSQKGNLR